MFKVGDPVRWTSSNTRKEGVIAAVVPPKRRPRDVGYDRLTGGSARDHESYVVRGGVSGQRQADYWPVVSLLHAAEGLTAAEVAWCHQNAHRIRAMIVS